MIKTTKIPKLRFKGFSGEWKKVRLGKIMAQIHRKNTINNDLIVTVSASNGLIPQTQFFTKMVASANLKNYILIQKDDFVYNKSYSKGFPFGVIKRLTNYENAIISPLYITFKIKNTKKQLPSWWDYYFHSQKINRELYKITQEGARNHGLLNLYTKDFFNILVLYPSLPEQRKIASFFSTLDDLINNLKQQKQKLEEYKKGLMQKLFPKKGENKPELRFPGFKDEWREVRLGEVSTIINGNKMPKWNSVGKYGIVFMGSITTNGELVISRFTDTIKGNLRLVPGDLVMVKDDIGNGLILGKTAIINTDNLLLGDHVFLIRVTSKNVNPIFLRFYINNNQTHKELRILSTGTSQKGLSKKEISKLKIHLPSLPEQRKIAKLLSRLDKLIELKQKQIEKLEEFKKGLMQRMFV